MRGEVDPQSSMFHYFSVESRIPADHPLRRVKKLAESALSAISAELDGLYARTGRPSIPPERLLKAQLLIAFYSVRSDRLFCEQLDYNLLFRWFLDLDLESGGLDQSNFSRLRERLVETDIARRFFDEVVRLARKDKLLSSDHFTVDGTLIDAWASFKSFKRKDDDDEGMDTDIESNVDDSMEKGKTGAKKSGGGKAKTDSDGYMAFKMPWSLTFGYGVTMREDTRREKFNEKSMRYPYKFTQNLNMSGNVRISDGWNISFSSGYDFDNHKLSMTTASLARDLHCFNMSCSVVLAPYTSYNFTFRCNAATLTDALKYDKRSGYSNAVQWY